MYASDPINSCYCDYRWSHPSFKNVHFALLYWLFAFEIPSKLVIHTYLGPNRLRSLPNRRWIWLQFTVTVYAAGSVVCSVRVGIICSVRWIYYKYFFYVRCVSAITGRSLNIIFFFVSLLIVCVCVICFEWCVARYPVFSTTPLCVFNTFPGLHRRI